MPARGTRGQPFFPQPRQGREQQGAARRLAFACTLVASIRALAGARTPPHTLGLGSESVVQKPRPIDTHLAILRFPPQYGREQQGPESFRPLTLLRRSAHSPLKSRALLTISTRSEGTIYRGLGSQGHSCGLW